MFKKEIDLRKLEKLMDKNEILKRCRLFRFMQTRITALDALTAFVPHGQEKDPVIEAAIKLKGTARWFPVEGGHRVLISYEAQEYDPGRFAVEKKAWDHEHCKACGADIEPKMLCWVSEPDSPFVILCVSCHDELEKP